MILNMILSLDEAVSRRSGMVVAVDRHETHPVNHRRKVVQPRSEGGSGSGAILRPVNTGVAGHVAAKSSGIGEATTFCWASMATTAEQPAIAKHPADISLQGALPLPASRMASQSGIPAIVLACAFIMASQGVDACAAP
jgi:hypothetical protein